MSVLPWTVCIQVSTWREEHLATAQETAAVLHLTSSPHAPSWAYSVRMSYGTCDFFCSVLRVPSHRCMLSSRYQTDRQNNWLELWFVKSHLMNYIICFKCYYYFVSLRVFHVWKGMMAGVGGRCVTAWVWRSEDKFVESVLFFYLYVGSRDQSQITRLMLQVPLAVEPSTIPINIHLFVCFVPDICSSP